jgi:hypothetical protein
MPDLPFHRSTRKSLANWVLPDLRRTDTSAALLRSESEWFFIRWLGKSQTRDPTNRYPHDFRPNGPFEIDGGPFRAGASREG